MFGESLCHKAFSSYSTMKIEDILRFFDLSFPILSDVFGGGHFGSEERPVSSSDGSLVLLNGWIVGSDNSFKSFFFPFYQMITKPQTIFHLIIERTDYRGRDGRTYHFASKNRPHIIYKRHSLPDGYCMMKSKFVL